MHLSRSSPQNEPLYLKGGYAILKRKARFLTSLYTNDIIRLNPIPNVMYKFLDTSLGMNPHNSANGIQAHLLIGGRVNRTVSIRNL